jgi:DNA-binding NtrC family response regulator
MSDTLELECTNHAQPSGLNGISVYSGDGHIRSLREIESDVFRLAVVHYRGRSTDIARHLRIGRSTVYRKLDELGIE